MDVKSIHTPPAAPGGRRHVLSEPSLLRELTADGVLVLTLNRPETMNALTGDISQGIQAAALESKTNDAIRAIVITGNGRGFCAGADLSGGGPARRNGGEPAAVKRSTFTDRVGPAPMVMALADADVPIIGAINGAAAGAGFGLALCCDIRIASEQARMGSIFIKRGLATDYGTSYWLPRIVGIAKAYELLYTGDILNAEQLLDVGLVNRVVPHDKLMEETMAFARRIASGPPLAYTYVRRNAARSLDQGLAPNLELEWSHQKELLRTGDAAEGFRAFLESRQPVFTGS